MKKPTWSKSEHAATASNVKENLYNLFLGNYRDRSGAFTIIDLYEQLEGDYFRHGKRFWYHITGPVKHVSGRFGCSLNEAKRRAVKKAAQLLEEHKRKTEKMLYETDIELESLWKESL